MNGFPLRLRTRVKPLIDRCNTRKYNYFLVITLTFFIQSPANANEKSIKFNISSIKSQFCTTNLNILVKKEIKTPYYLNSMMIWVAKADRVPTENEKIFRLLSPQAPQTFTIEYFEIIDNGLKNYDGDNIIFTKNNVFSQVRIQVEKEKVVIFLTDYLCMLHDGEKISALILRSTMWQR